MIKCPHCGSTAQVKSNGNPIISKNTGYLVEGFHCGCGCEWEIEYERNDKGFWEFYAKFVTNEPKEKSKGHIHCPCNGYDCPYWKDGICSLYSEEENWQILGKNVLISAGSGTKVMIILIMTKL